MSESSVMIRKKWSFITILSASLLYIGSHAEAVSANSLDQNLKKIYIRPEKIWVDASGLYILDQGDLHPVGQIGFDRGGVYCADVKWNKCPQHHKWYNLLGGCVDSHCDYYYRKHRD